MSSAIVNLEKQLLGLFDDRKSVFDKRYIPKSKASDDFNEDDHSGAGKLKGFFEISSQTIESLTYKSGLGSTLLRNLTTDNIWQFVLTRFTEQHIEKASPMPTISESMNIFALGPNAVDITASGYLLATRFGDYRTQFLYQYANLLRFKKLSDQERSMRLVVEDTCMDFIIRVIQLADNVAMPTYTTFSIVGSGYNYKNYNSKETTYTGYFGKTAAIPTTVKS